MSKRVTRSSIQRMLADERRVTRSMRGKCLEALPDPSEESSNVKKRSTGRKRKASPPGIETSSKKPQKPIEVQLSIIGDLNSQSSQVFHVNIHKENIYNVSSSTVDRHQPSQASQPLETLPIPEHQETEQNASLEEDCSELTRRINNIENYLSAVPLIAEVELDRPNFTDLLENDDMEEINFAELLREENYGTDYTPLTEVELCDAEMTTASESEEGSSNAGEYFIPALRSEKASEDNRTARRKKNMPAVKLQSKSQRKEMVKTFSKADNCTKNCSIEHNHISAYNPFLRYLCEEVQNFTKFKKRGDLKCLSCEKEHKMEEISSFLVCNSETCRAKSRQNFLESARGDFSDSDCSFSDADCPSQEPSDFYNGIPVDKYFVKSEAGRIPLWDSEKRLIRLPRRCKYRMYLYECPEYISIYKTGKHIDGDASISPKKRSFKWEKTKSMLPDIVDDLLKRGPVNMARVSDMLRVQGLEGGIPEEALKKRVRRVRSKNNDNLDNIKKVIFMNTEQKKNEEQEWFLFRDNLFSGKDVNMCTKDDVNVGLGRSVSEENVPDFFHQPFLIGITSRKLFDRAHEHWNKFEEAPRILHIDATYKLSFAKFEAFVVGYSDRNSKFFLLSIFISSGKDSNALSQMFQSIEELWFQYYNEPFGFTHIMSDADTAMASFWSENYSDRKLLMCYRHMKEAVKKRIQKESELISHKLLIMSSVENLHYCQSDEELTNVWRKELLSWNRIRSQAFQDFVRYFKKTWIDSKFKNWQIFHTPSGYAKTNNPVETKHKSIKDFVNRKKYTLGELMIHLGNYITKDCSTEVMFSSKQRTELSLHMKRYYGHMKKILKLTFGNDEYFVSYSNPRNPPESREKDHYHSVETFGMPKKGWRLTWPFEECGCRYFHKHSICIHICFAREHYSRLNIGRTSRNRVAGRPRAMAGAWSRDSNE